MRRITLAAVCTFAVLVLLFSYRTSRGKSGSDAAQAVSAARVVGGGGASVIAGAGTASVATGQGPDPHQASTPPKVTVTEQQSVPAPDPGSSTRSTTATTAPSRRSPTPTSTAPSKPTPSTPSPIPTPTSAAPITVDGASEMTNYGVVQVRVVVTGDKITDVTAVQYPQGSERDQEINATAIPQLRNEVLAAQSANVQAVSGATFTTGGYLGSLQSALDAAGFKK
ncbi:MAG: FMN-binding protein [Actinomycetota bacterium]|nr:FMN-binding protein [Actinomycetota bacterium]